MPNKHAMSVRMVVGMAMVGLLLTLGATFSHGDGEGEHEKGKPPNPQQTASGGFPIEVSKAVDAAQRFRFTNNLPRARKMIEQAYALAPRHPNVLAEYGAVEEEEGNTLKADGFFTKALHLEPLHAEATHGRERVKQAVDQHDTQMWERIHAEREAFQQIPASDPGLRAEMARNYNEYVYQSLALEGNTLSMEEVRTILETGNAVAGKSLLEQNEVLGLDRALQMVGKSLLTTKRIELHHILAIHAEVMRFASPDIAGQIRNEQCIVGSHTPPLPEEVPHQLETFLEWLNREETRTRVDAVEVAALAHYHVVAIHPFCDGNGRTTRVLMSLLLVQAGYPLVVVPIEEREAYRAALRDGDHGDRKSFVRFVAEMTSRSLKKFINAENLKPGSQRAESKHPSKAEVWGVERMESNFMKTLP